MAPSSSSSAALRLWEYIPSAASSKALFYGLLVLPTFALVLALISSELARRAARIPNLPGPRGYPIVGSLPSLKGKVPGEQYRLWAKKYGDVFQVQLGERTAVVVNSASAARSLFLGQREAMKSRPIFYVLHGKVQGGSLITSIGTSPWNQSCKNRRRAAATAMNKVAVDSYQPVRFGLTSLPFLLTHPTRSSTPSREKSWQIFLQLHSEVPMERLTSATRSGNMR